jgi:hypothetical protein
VPVQLKLGELSDEGLAYGLQGAGVDAGEHRLRHRSNPVSVLLLPGRGDRLYRPSQDLGLLLCELRQ